MYYLVVGLLSLVAAYFLYRQHLRINILYGLHDKGSEDVRKLLDVSQRLRVISDIHAKGGGSTVGSGSRVIRPTDARVRFLEAKSEKKLKELYNGLP